MATFEAQRRARLDELKVDKEEISKSMWEPLPTVHPSCLRVAIYNTLADSMSDDGFLVKPILADWPADKDMVPTKEGENVHFRDLLAEMMSSKGDLEALQRCQAKYNIPVSQENTHATVDWEARRSQMMCFLECFSPDIMVFTEVDHYAEFVSSLRGLGYVSQLPTASASSPYRPAHLDSFSDKTPEKARLFQQEWESRGYAFLPHLGSVSMHVHMQTTGLDKRILEAARKSGEPDLVEKIADPKKGLLSRNWYQLIQPGTSKMLLENAGVEDAASLDDMGVAVFWKDRRLLATELRTQPYPGGGKGFVQVKLQDRKDPEKSVVVMGTHLSSGDTPKDEDERLQCELLCEGGLIPEIHQLRASGENLVVCMDANSDPSFKAATSPSTCWKELRQAVGNSVWDGFFTPDGNFLDQSDQGLEQPVTTNKVRGPQSAQAKKIGNHAYYLIDHIFYSPGSFGHHDHVYKPMQFRSAEDALQKVLPSLKDPSDHYPVIVDLGWAK